MCEMMSKGLKEALTVLIVTHITHVKRDKSVLCIKWPLVPPKYVIRAHNIFTDHFLNIQLIFNQKKVLKSCDFLTIPSNVMYDEEVKSYSGVVRKV